jgi:MFS transporter, AAHS family, 4-hydroxybenzoate transporter
MYPTSIRSTGIGWAMGMGRVGQVFGPVLTGLLVGAGYKVGGIFYAAAIPCFVGALFLVFLKFARPVMEADAAAPATNGAADPARPGPKAASVA